jgi:uncharacterized membrane protein
MGRAILYCKVTLTYPLILLNFILSFFLPSNMFPLILIAHILGGCIALLSGLLNLLLRKGGKRHRLIGNIFVYSMMDVGITALILSVMHPSPFLFSVGILSMYFAYTGKRYLYRNTLNLVDYLILIMVGATAIYLIYKGTFLLMHQEWFGLVFLFFSTLLGLGVWEELKWRNLSLIKAELIQIHVQRICGAYIASVTALLVVNGSLFPFLSPTLLWLLPSICLTPVIIYWKRKYAKKASN